MSNPKERRLGARSEALALVQSALRDLPQGGRADVLQMRDALDVIVQPQGLRGVIQSILGNPEEMKRISQKSYRHITGMERLELASEGGYGLRVHYWMPRDREVFTEDPHSHIYNFASKVMSGVLITDLFTEGEDGDDMDMYRIGSQNSKLAPIPEFVGKTRLKAITPSGGILLSDSNPSYTMTNEVIHRTRQGDPSVPIITLNLRGSDVKDRSTFYREPGVQKPTLPVVQIDVARRLNLLLDRLVA